MTFVPTYRYKFCVYADTPQVTAVSGPYEPLEQYANSVNQNHTAEAPVTNHVDGTF